jgi:hypothetical protein
MAVTLQREATEFIYSGVTGAVPSVGAEIALLAANTRPTSGDWKTAVVVNNNAHALWPDASASGLTGDYFVALLIGEFGGNTVAPGDWQVWLRLTDTTEQPVRILPTVLTVA